MACVFVCASHKIHVILKRKFESLRDNYYKSLFKHYTRNYFPENEKCYIAWKFKNPGQWNVQDMMKKFKSISTLVDFKIEFIYEGSFVMICSTTHKIANVEFSENRIADFVRQFAMLAEIDTNRVDMIEVEMICWPRTHSGWYHLFLLVYICFILLPFKMLLMSSSP